MSGAAGCIQERLFAAARVLPTIPGGDFKTRKDADIETSCPSAKDTRPLRRGSLSKPQRSPAEPRRQQQSCPKHRASEQEGQEPHVTASLGRGSARPATETRDREDRDTMIASRTAALTGAAACGNDSVVRDILRPQREGQVRERTDGVGVDSREPTSGRTALHFAILNDRLTTVDLLLLSLIHI